jgi:hypothetical protein
MNDQRERLLYSKMQETGITEPFEQAFFFPTKEDVALAKKGLRFIEGLPPTDDRATAIRLVSEKVGVPARFLRIVRGLKDRL